MSSANRRSLVADAKVQGTLVRRLVMYWCFAWFVVITLAVAVSSIIGLTVEGVSASQIVTSMLSYFWLPVMISIMVLPILIRDCLRLSNRFAGPVLRLRRALKALAEGEQVEPIRLRTGDFWQETAEDFNRVLQRIQLNAVQPELTGHREDTQS